MRVAVRTNVDEVFGKLDAFVDQIETVASVRALNKLRDQAQTAGFRRINDLYQIGPRTMDTYTRTTFATPQSPECEITVKGAGFPLYAFKPKQTKAGVSVLVKGRRLTIPHTFIARMPSGHVGVFARGAYGGKGSRAIRQTDVLGRFVFGRGVRVKRRNRWGSSELPINELYTFGPVESFTNPEVTTAMQDRVEEQAPVVLAQEIRFATRG